MEFKNATFVLKDGEEITLSGTSEQITKKLAEMGYSANQFVDFFDIVKMESFVIECEHEQNKVTNMSKNGTTTRG